MAESQSQEAEQQQFMHFHIHWEANITLLTVYQMPYFLHMLWNLTRTHAAGDLQYFAMLFTLSMQENLRMRKHST